MRTPEEVRLLDPYGEAFGEFEDDDESELVAHSRGSTDTTKPTRDHSWDFAGSPRGEARMSTVAKQDRFMSVMGKEIKGPVWMQFSIAVIGLTSTAMLFEFLQELIFRHPDWHHGAFMTLCGMLVMAVSPIFTMAVQGKHDEIRKTKWASYVPLTVVLALQQSCGTAALSYINFPVKVVIKSSKLIPTMGLGLLLLRRTYTLAEYTAAVMIWLGVAGFTLVDSTVSPKFSTFGVSLLIIAVLGDAVGTNLQERLLRQLNCPKQQMMFASNMMGAAWVFIIIFMTGEFSTAAAIIWKEPYMGWRIFAMAIAQYLSVSFYLALVQRFGGVVAVTVTSCRKVLTLALSFAVFPKPFTAAYIPSGLLTLVGILLSAFARQENVNHRRIRGLQCTGVFLIMVFAVMWSTA